MAVANPALYCVVRRTARERERNPHPDWIGEMGKHQSDRSQVIGGGLLIGQLAPWVTWDI